MPLVCPVRRICSFSPVAGSQVTMLASAPPLIRMLLPLRSWQARTHFTKSVCPPVSRLPGARVVRDHECMHLSHEPANIDSGASESGGISASEVKGAVEAGERKTSSLEPV